MEVGEYCRAEISSLNLQRIGKIKKIISEDFIHTDIGTYDKENIIKHSPNIIDLIEVGDYVNGSYVEGFIEKNKFQNKLIITEAGMIDNNDIKSIVTKEMYSSVEYRVEIN